MADSLIDAARAVLGGNEDSDAVDPERLEEHQEELREQMTGGAGDCLQLSLAANALRKHRDAERDTGDADERGSRA